MPQDAEESEMKHWKLKAMPDQHQKMANRQLYCPFEYLFVCNCLTSSVVLNTECNHHYHEITTGKRDKKLEIIT